MRRKCKACKDGPIVGVLNNAERCDTCERYPSDHDARLALVSKIHSTRRRQRRMWAIRAYKNGGSR